MTFGARMLKTGLAVTLALYVASWLGLSAPVIAAVASIFAMQPSIYRSWTYLRDQLQTNTLGAILAMLGGTFFSNEPIAVGLVCIVVIMICLQLKMGDTIGVTLVTVIVVMEASGDWEFALNRFILILIGVISSFVINIVVYPPKPKTQFNIHVHQAFEQLSLLLRTSISDEMKESVYRDEKKQLEDAINKLSDQFTLLEEDQKRLKHSKFSDSRQLVIYKQMLRSLRKGYDVLDTVEQHYFQTSRSSEIHTIFDAQLERLAKFHEQVMLKYDSKLKPNMVEAKQFETENHHFLEKMLELYGEQKDGVMRLSIVSAEMYEYGHQLERLNRLTEHAHLAND